MIKAFSAGFFSVLKGLFALTKPGIRRYIAIPLVINISLFGVTIYYAASRFSEWMDKLLPSWLDWLNWLIWPLFAITIAIIVFYSFTIIANLIAAPFNSLLAEKYERLLRGESLITEDKTSIVSLIGRTVSAEMKKWVYMIKWFIPLIIVTFIPVINVIAPPLWIVFALWMLSLEYLDYPMGNHNHLFPEIRDTAHNNRMLSLGFGAGMFFMTSIPLLNFFAMPTGVIAATRLWVNNIDEKALKG